ncbi:MAG TPA: helix-turn-helix domain-containing protein [Candidatus Polarisedimenticolia bacterium]|nr:helix-turn-helix domain-containing protein [Candidatus Polarisedimenticolia bacterium]
MPGRRLAGEERSQAIVKAALGIFAREGFDGTTTRSLARAAGVSEALLFKHFPNKRALYRAILQYKIDDAERAFPLEDSLLSLGDEAFFLRIATHLMRRVDADDTFCRLMLRSAMDGHDLARRFRKARSGKLLGLIEEKIRRRGARPGAGSTVDPRLAARIFSGMIFSAMLNRRIFREEIVSRTSLDDLARAMVRVFLEGIGGVEEGS